MNSTHVVGLDPTGARQVAPVRELAARKPDLRGAVVGLVCNGVGRSEDLLRAVYAELEQSHGVRGALLVGKPNRSVPPVPADWQRLLRETTVAITGFGGCGSCSTRSLRDALELEWAGVPSVAIVHEQLVSGVQTMAMMSGFPDYEYIVVDSAYPALATWTDEQVAAVAAEVADRVATLLIA